MSGSWENWYKVMLLGGGVLFVAIWTSDYHITTVRITMVPCSDAKRLAAKNLKIRKVDRKS